MEQQQKVFKCWHIGLSGLSQEAAIMGSTQLSFVYGSKGKNQVFFQIRNQSPSHFSNCITINQKICSVSLKLETTQVCKKFIVPYWVSLEDHWALWSLLLPEGPQVCQCASTSNSIVNLGLPSDAEKFEATICPSKHFFRLNYSFHNWFYHHYSDPIYPPTSFQQFS